MNKIQCYYTDPATYLQQGDIFRIDVVAPGADTIKRIFRTEDGRHGSVFFEGGCRAKIFDHSELDSLLTRTARTELHTSPFSKTPDGQDEMVIATARLLQYFIIGTQTCDVVGKEKAASEYVTILPIVPLRDMCMSELLPFKSTEKPMTINDFVVTYCKDGQQLVQIEADDYGAAIKILVIDALKNNPTNKVKGNLRQINNFLKKYYKKGFMFSLRDEPKYGVPESYVDFSVTFTVPSSKLLEIKQTRIACIAPVYREAFGSSLAYRFGRIATEKPMKPDNLD